MTISVPVLRGPRLRSAGTPKYRWRVFLPDGTGGLDEIRFVPEAGSASEARALAKAHLGLKRLPVGAFARKVREEG